MKPREVPLSEDLRAAREIEAAGGAGLRPVRLGILATFTTTTLAAPLVVEGARRGLYLRPAMAPFGQLEPQAFDASSAKLAVPASRRPAGIAATVRPATSRRRNSAVPARASSKSIRIAPADGFGTAARIR